MYDGFENFERALARGKGVLFLTAHLGGVGTLRICSFAVRPSSSHRDAVFG